MGVSKRPQPSLNITPLQNRKREKEGDKHSPNHKRSENLPVKSFFFLSLLSFRIQCVCLIAFLIHFVAPGGAGGARSGWRIVCMQTGRHGYCMRLGIYGGTDGSEDTARLKSHQEWTQESPSAVVVGGVRCAFLSSDFFLHLILRYELPGCDVPPKLWSALPPCSGVQGVIL